MIIIPILFVVVKCTTAWRNPEVSIDNLFVANFLNIKFELLYFVLVSL